MSVTTAADADRAVAPPRPGRRLAAPAIVALGVVLLVVRSWDHLLHATFWAEDGWIFYSQARLTGLGAVWTPYAGYVHVLPRLLTIPVVALPVAAGPVATVWLATVADLALMASVLTPRLRWLIPSAAWRAVLFVAIVLIPAQYETLNNLANLIFMGGTALAVIALSDPPRTPLGRGAELVAVAVLGLSGPIVLLLLPLFVHRVVRTRSRQAVVGLLVAAGCGAAQLVTFLTTSVRAEAATGGTASQFVRVVTLRGPDTWMFGLVPSSAAGNLLGPLHVVTGLAVLWLVGAGLALWVTRGWRVTVALVVAVAALFAAPVWAYGASMLDPLFGNRHVVTPMALLLLALTAAASSLRRGDAAPGAGRRRVAGVVAIVLLAAGGYGVTERFAPLAWKQPTDTGSLDRCLRSTAAVCQTPVSPPGFSWRVVVRGPVPQ